MPVTLRRITSADTPNIVRWRNNPRVRERFIYQEPFTAEGHERWLRTQVEPGHVAQFIIVDSESGQDVGSVFLRDIDPAHRKAEIGIFIGEDTGRGRGLGPAAIRQLTAYGFRELGLHRIFARVLADNAASLHTFERAGYRRDGCFRDDVWAGGRFQDVVFLSRLESDPE